MAGVEVKHGTRGNVFAEITKFRATKLNLKLCNRNFLRIGRFNLKYDVRANRRRGVRVLTLDIMQCITSREKSQKHLDQGGASTYPDVMWHGATFSEFWISPTCRAMHFWNSGHLRSSPGSRQGDKKAGENREKEYVWAAAAYIQQSAEKRGHSSPNWEWVEARFFLMKKCNEDRIIHMYVCLRKREYF